MSIRIVNVVIEETQTSFTAPIRFEITFDCLAPGVSKELEWKVVYVGSAENEKYDQVLDCVLVGPVLVGRNKFVLEVPGPNPKKILNRDILELTVLLLTCSYNSQEFIRIGYYVNTSYPEELLPPPPAPEQIVIPGTPEAQSVEEVDADANGSGIENEEEEDYEEEESHCDDNDDDVEDDNLIEVQRIPDDFQLDYSLLSREVLSAPRVTRFDIPWDQKSLSS